MNLLANAFIFAGFAILTWGAFEIGFILGLVFAGALCVSSGIVLAKANPKGPKS